MQTQDLNYLISIYKEQLQKGDVQRAYTKLVKYIMKLKTLFSKDLANDFSFGNIFQGYMDYTYFYYSNDYLKNRKLKLGLVLNHEEMRFEIWLLGQTKEIHAKYWNLLKTTKWVNTIELPQYAIFETVIVENPNFNDLSLLSEQIKNELTKVSNEIIASLKVLD